MKGQSQVIQFVIFFLIGISVFGVVGNFYKTHAQIERNRIEKAYLGLLKSYLSEEIISKVVTCKTCDYINFTIKINNQTAGYYNVISLISKPSMMFIDSVPALFSVNSSLHNLNYSLSMEGSSPSVKKLLFSYIEKTNKLLLVGE